MKIDSSSIGFTSQHASLKQHTVEETLRVWTGKQRPDFEGLNATEHRSPSSKAAISDAARQAAKTIDSVDTRADQANELSKIEDAVDHARNDPKLQVLISVVEALTGKKIRLLDTGVLAFETSDAPPSQKPASTEAAQTEQRQGWGLEYDKLESIHEAEQTSFSAQGIIRTADGKEIKFQISLEMKREFSSQSNVSIRAGDAVRKDPLVINFDGTAAQLSNTKFDFDIDSDGQTDHIAFVNSRSGFLALDKNGNGVIDDGSELFGTQSGNGFADLSAYDEDGNGWIDENDTVYAELRIWTKDAAGNDTLSTLAEHEIGALYLGNTSTPFDLKDNNNTQHGQVRSTGIYLYENGRAGTLQQIDLFV
ncbi:hypothetical protein KVP09_04145 [Alcaligenaceae bacterium CGII-47]|nr:hypothetical protein [Alcaligenaceae bacterium CGII-47]